MVQSTSLQYGSNIVHQCFLYLQPQVAASASQPQDVAAPLEVTNFAKKIIPLHLGSASIVSIGAFVYDCVMTIVFGATTAATYFSKSYDTQKSHLQNHYLSLKQIPTEVYNHIWAVFQILFSAPSSKDVQVELTAVDTPSNTSGNAPVHAPISSPRGIQNASGSSESSKVNSSEINSQRISPTQPERDPSPLSLPSAPSASTMEIPPRILDTPTPPPATRRDDSSPEEDVIEVVVTRELYTPTDPIDIPVDPRHVHTSDLHYQRFVPESTRVTIVEVPDSEDDSSDDDFLLEGEEFSSPTPLKHPGVQSLKMSSSSEEEVTASPSDPSLDGTGHSSPSGFSTPEDEDENPEA